MSEPETPEARSPDRDMVRAWADYAKHRFDSAEARIVEYRSWARQLIAAIGVVIGLEVTIVARLALDARLPLQAATRSISLILLLLPLVVQFSALRRLLHIGYRGAHLLAPESPTVLADYLVEKDEAEAHRMIGAYYAKGYDHFHHLAENLGRQIGTATTWFQWSLLPVLIGVALLATSALWIPPSSANNKSIMREKPAAMPSTTPVPPSAQPKGTQPADPPPNAKGNPLIVTPTGGNVETHGAKPGKNQRYL
jgi:hypothetical protein